jgi:hypothetical protein
MNIYTFTAYGEEFTAPAETGRDLFREATNELLWRNPEYKAGMWVETYNNTYIWTEGAIPKIFD